MIRVRVVNIASGRWGQMGLASRKEWAADNFWVEVLFGNQIATVARRNMTQC